MHSNSNQAGFTLLELMVTIAIIAIIASIAIPSYLNYTKKTHYAELVQATAPYKLGVVECYHQHGSFEQCHSDNKPVDGMPPSITTPPNKQSTIGKITVTRGVITAEPNTVSGITADEVYILTPTATKGIISWMASGKGVTDGLAK